MVRQGIAASQHCKRCIKPLDSICVSLRMTSSMTALWLGRTTMQPVIPGSMSPSRINVPFFDHRHCMCLGQCGLALLMQQGKVLHKVGRRVNSCTQTLQITVTNPLLLLMVGFCSPAASLTCDAIQPKGTPVPAAGRQIERNAHGCDSFAASRSMMYSKTGATLREHALAVIACRQTHDV